ncbi:MAG: hypothetical protein ACYDAC_05145 [Candidatus Dormibacteria bacterium]
MEQLNVRFPAGDAVMREVLRREGVRPDLVELRLAYTGVSWSLHVRCPSVSYQRVSQLAPEDLRADTAWMELCESIAAELAERTRRPGR